MTAYGVRLPYKARTVYPKVLSLASLQVSAVDHTASTVMCVLGLGESISKQYGLGIAAREVLPMLTPLLVLPSLSGQQFSSAMRYACPMHSLSGLQVSSAMR